MKFVQICLAGIVAAKSKKTCDVEESEKKCPTDYSWNQDACTCLIDYWCEIGCPVGQTNSPLEVCNCIEQCVYDELFTDDIICSRAKAGEVCEGFNESTGQPFPSCDEGLDCKSSGEITIPGAGKTCVPQDSPIQESGSLFGLSLIALMIIGFSLF